MENNESVQRRQFLSEQGVRTKESDMSAAVYTLQSIQAGLMDRLERVTREMVCTFFPFMREHINKEDFAQHMQGHKIVCSPVSTSKNGITGWSTITFAVARRVLSDDVAKKNRTTAFVKRAFYITHRVLPIPGTGQLKLEVEHKSCEFPKDVSITQSL